MIELCALVLLYEDLCFGELDTIIATCSLFSFTLKTLMPSSLIGKEGLVKFLRQKF